jgi:1,2-diacylglycerol-3-alpha-glucose alpha-1,2-glucosyltransferase
MKNLLFFEKQNSIKQSGIGRAMTHQMKALELANVEFTLDPNDNYDFAHINTLFFESYRLLKKLHKKGMKVIVHGHSTVEDFRYSFRCWRLIAPIFNHLILRMYRHADLIITPTNYSKGLIEGYKGVNCPIYAVSNGIKLEDYKYNEEDVKAFDDFFNIKDKKIVICAGLYFERKGIRDFFEIAKSMPDVEFIWFGHLTPILTQSKIRRAIKKRPKNVLMPGYVDIKVLRGAFHRADCFLFLSYEENEGIAVLEALASRLPVIVRDIPVFKDWLIDGRDVLKGKTNAEFIEKLNYVFNNDMEAFKDNAYKVVEARTLEHVGKELKEIYESLYNKKQA